MSVAAFSVVPVSRLTTTDRQEDQAMIIDCYRCQARGVGCAVCAATHVLGDTLVGDDPTDLDPAELRALTVLANAGLIPPLRYAPRLARAS
jgi:hypothetical protein